MKVRDGVCLCEGMDRCWYLVGWRETKEIDGYV